jgi:nitrate/nitrite transporter NarK
MMPILKKNLSLGPVQVSVALAVPILLGSLGRIPLGMLTDRYGGRLIFSVVMVSSIAPALIMGLVADYWQLIVSQSKLEEDPRLKIMWAGYAFAADFREERGRAVLRRVW